MNNTLETKKITKNILIEKIEEKNKATKWIINVAMLLGSSGFLIVGISSYINFNLIPLLNAKEIIFFPQGIVMTFYGIIGLLFSVNQILILYWKIGEGYNEFDKNKNKLKIYRKGFPGKNEKIELNYNLSDIEAIKLEIKTELFNTKQKIYLCIKDQKDLPIIQINDPLKIREIEEKASKIASFLNVSIKS